MYAKLLHYLSSSRPWQDWNLDIAGHLQPLWAKCDERLPVFLVVVSSWPSDCCHNNAVVPYAQTVAVYDPSPTEKAVRNQRQLWPQHLWCNWYVEYAESCIWPTYQRHPTKHQIYHIATTTCPTLLHYRIYFLQCNHMQNKKAQLSLTKPCDAKACQKLLQFDVLTMLSLTILVHLHSFSCCCIRVA